MEVIEDTINAGLLLAKRHKNIGTDKLKFKEFETSLKKFKNYLIFGRFRIDEAIEATAKVAYVLAKIKQNDFSPIQRYDKQIHDNQDYLFNNKHPYNFLNKMKNLRNGALFYWFEAVGLLRKKE